MVKRYIPYAYAKNIYEIDPNFIKSLKVTTVLADLDNTLDSYRSYEPSTEAFILRDSLKALGIDLVIISNNRGKRVSTYANHLEVPYLSSAGKPFGGKIRKYLLANNRNLQNTILIGDQIMTDVKCAHRVGIKVILTDKLVPEDQITTRFNRLFDRPIRKSLKKKLLLVDWRAIYEHNEES